MSERSWYWQRRRNVFKDRLDAGQDTPIDLTTARLTPETAARYQARFPKED